MTLKTKSSQERSPQIKKTREQNHRGNHFVPFLGALPYFAFVAAFLIIPIIANVVTAFQDATGQPSTETMAEAMGQAYREAFLLTFNLSLLTTVIGGFFGVIIAWALTTKKSGPKWLSNLVNSFSALAAQSGGVQLAYAFIALLGTQGLLTGVIKKVYPNFGEVFSITDFAGVSLVYLYFQVPLMTVLMLPSMSALKKEWYDAASSLGATKGQYLRDVALPVLWPPIVGSLLLLFANAFAAYATAYALAGGSLNLIPIVIGFLISGNVLLNPGLAAALVTWMMIIILVAMGLRLVLTRRSDKWLSN
ncbi:MULTISPECIES: ABC transporter permease subunit [Corynebacterium]|uniref:ABC transporter permease subunit n=1 Tax=Corynebacterium singulare TaxID=161899 RepID=A0ABS9PVZ6_9CORY|nr:MULTISPECIES: ABC transporter permease subunit [Corynebacterium]MCG7276877.1 ABC transporter permease subunit [Corynebacterium singulare]MCQ9677403.1 ABC transporter permease subunit [Corynebacterium sp. BF-R-2]